MHLRLFLPLILLSVLILPAFGQDVISSDNGPVILEPDVEENLESIPINEETGTVNWDEYSRMDVGPGAIFGFITVLYPPDPAALANTPEFLLDTAWIPPIPFSFGYQPPEEGDISAHGWWYLEDASGNLGRRDMDISDGIDSLFSSTWFLGGNGLFHLEESWTDGYYLETSYLPDDWTGGGIDFFLRSVWFRGVLYGERMENLLNVCGAIRFGRSPIEGGRDHLAIWQILPNETDRQNGRGSLLVWTTIGDWRLVRTRLHAAYATEVTEYASMLGEVQNDPMVFYSEFLPENIYWSIDHYLLTHNTPFWDAYVEAFDIDPGYEPSLPEGSIEVVNPEGDEEVEGEEEAEIGETEEPEE